jgi:hypothetical protein
MRLGSQVQNQIGVLVWYQVARQDLSQAAFQVRKESWKQVTYQVGDKVRNQVWVQVAVQVGDEKYENQ